MSIENKQLLEGFFFFFWKTEHSQETKENIWKREWHECAWGPDLCVLIVAPRVRHNFDNPTSLVLLPCVSLPWRFSMMTVQMPCVPTPMASFSCFLLTTVGVLLSLVSLPWLCSCVTVSSVRGAAVGGVRRGTRTCINSSCGAQCQAASGKDSRVRWHPALCNHCSPSQHEKGQLPLHILYRRTALEHFVMTPSLLICILKYQGGFKHAKSCWLGSYIWCFETG